MALSEFSLIEKYFARQAALNLNENVTLGIGDDAALINVPADQLLVQTIDTLISGRHFPEASDAADIAYKSLAVNVSDLVAMAATPSHFLLSLSLPNNDKAFLKDFSRGLFEASEVFNISLVGGDTCKGPLSITIQTNGLVPHQSCVTRSKARQGDRIFVSGQLGTAALGLAILQGKVEMHTNEARLCLQALNRPQPQLQFINLLRSFASSAIDISDGLVGDLAHILQQSRVGATLQKQSIPVLDWIRQQDVYHYALSGGDDYQLLFTVPENKVELMLKQAGIAHLAVTDIGVITPQNFILQDGSQQLDLSELGGFDHFVS